VKIPEVKGSALSLNVTLKPLSYFDAFVCSDTKEIVLKPYQLPLTLSTKHPLDRTGASWGERARNRRSKISVTSPVD
jgi:hypothetical protein